MDRSENGYRFAARIAGTVIEQYRGLSKKGKAIVGEEWSPLAAVVLVGGDGQGKNCGQDLPVMKVVALGTGSKCIGQQRMSRRGWVVNDSHAEVLARRAFCRYLQGQIGECLRGSEQSVMVRGGQGRVRVKSQYSFHFFATQPPCGDACIFPVDAGGGQIAQTAGGGGRGRWVEHLLSNQVDPTDDSVSSNTSDNVTNDSSTSDNVINDDNTSGCVTNDKITAVCDTSGDFDVPHAKRLKQSFPPSPPQPGPSPPQPPSPPPQLDPSSPQPDPSPPQLAPSPSRPVDIHRTGARCTMRGECDPHLPGVGYHLLGALRTKPGRGDPTLSMACSDKMLRWNVLGCQGGLLASQLECPLYFASFTFLDTLFNETAVRRALYGRLSLIAEALAKDGEISGRGYRLSTPDLHMVKAREVLSQEELTCMVPSDLLRPAPGGVCWCAAPPLHDVVVQGVKQGASSRRELSRSSSVFVCKARWLEDFKGLVETLPDDCLPQCLQVRAASCSYRECKQLDTVYCKARRLFLQFCPSWMENAEEYEHFK